MKINGATALIRSLEAEGVEVLFGYPGGAVLPIYDALLDSKIRHILVRHEQGASHAADGYARASGKVGVCLGTSGPGATNLVTGICNAHMDSIPMVVLTGQVPSYNIGTDAFQEADIFGITLPIVKHSYLIKDVHDIPRVVKEAFHIASTGRPGPVLIDVPSDISKAIHQFKLATEINLPGYKPTTGGHPRQIKAAVELLRGSKRPIIYCGGGVMRSGAAAELRQLAHKIDAPVTTTIMGLGAFPESDPKSLGMLGMHGTSYANWAITRADAMLAIGVRFDDRVTGNKTSFGQNAKIIHIDIDPAEIEKNIKVDVPIVGDVREVLRALLEELDKNPPPPDRSEWYAAIDTIRAKYPLGGVEDAPVELKPQYAIRRLSKLTHEDVIVCVDVGQHQMWTAQYWGFTRANRWLSSSGLGTMGFGLPAAVGAQLACPDNQVVVISGDGSIQMCIQELAVVATEKLPVKIFIMNNGYLGMVRQWQEQMYNHRYSEVSLPHDAPPDFVKLAEAYGIRGMRITDVARFDQQAAEALAHDGPVLVDVRVAREENVTPMVKPGGHVHEQVEDEV
ncbi:MAG: biosynthetic-type acetolactate synthase large subunit [Deltaproteobacteria bacterium]|nr:biosynthetic-type acetolactate synthase large subunit [Deltaproteobacteria bacterium]